MTRTDRARFWAKHLSRQRRGLLSGREYCAKHRLAVSSFRYWSRKLRVSGTDPAPLESSAPRLVPVELLAAEALPMRGTTQGASGIALHTGAVRIELGVGFDVPTLRRALEALGC
ncbi:MAG: hypothetical protein KBG75_14775 [Pseudomonadales bacterium]|jgi:hypothetical protein|nr:hypothetical protein [Pseudomonadales bacterium]